jgi:hypothetical protein
VAIDRRWGEVRLKYIQTPERSVLVASREERMRRTTVVVAGLLLVLCCAASATGALLYLYRPRAASKPVVLISSPRQGEDVRVGEAVAIHALARDRANIARVELWVDGELWKAQNSSFPHGTSPFPLVSSWQPASPGAHTLAVRAFNTEGVRAYSSVMVEAGQEADRDDDGIPDEGDLCPAEPGFGPSLGCPDGDGDGVADAEDACPDQVGVREERGCPSATEEDRDGDGVPDAEDACPDEPGLAQGDGCPRGEDLDGDGVHDDVDECPGEPGLSELGGCPDLDGDGIADRDDECPSEPGSPEQGGCPDRDEDGGAPGAGAPDSDGDGVADDVDRCEDEAGLLAHDGCPPPEHGEDLDGDGIADEDEAPEGPTGLIPAFPLDTPPVVVEVEGMEFLLGQQYDEVACYVGVGDYLERYGPYELEGGTRWDIATDLGGDNSVVVDTAEGEPLEVFLECEAYVGDEPPLHLGVLRQEHAPEEWDGRRLSGRSEREEEPFGATFVVRYRICEGSCEEASLQVPLAWQAGTWLNEDFVDRHLNWQWEGEEEAIDEFRIRYNCYNRSGQWWRGAVLRAPKADRRISILAFEPTCYNTCEWSVSAYRASDGAQSPESNGVLVDVGLCARGQTVTVNFETFRPIPDVCGRGPIYGSFWANEEVLSFDGAGEAYCGFYEYECGYYAQRPGDSYPTVGELFAAIGGLQSGCSSCSYEAPSYTGVTVPLPEGDALTIGFEVWEYHHEGEDILLCRAESAFEYDELRNTDYYVWPSYDIEVPCRVEVSMSIWPWIGG